eukprot:TRINITY_DN3844_c0_g1_i1.p1 TRINITY_DN3844_c0_g1~~TRINITY_DN3844_c0_g1_i1.p1  ORF type:complete len:808 (+),score=209.08 TRINITY_DN3844_c0_g1_i1:121-2544(+)
MGAAEKTKLRQKLIDLQTTSMSAEQIRALVDEIAAYPLDSVSFFTTMGVTELRNLHQQQPNNIYLVLAAAIQSLEMTTGALAHASLEADLQRAIGLVRIISRVIPVGYELKWTGSVLFPGAPIAPKEESAEEDSEEISTVVESDTAVKPPGRVLIDSLMHLLFMPGFAALPSVLTDSDPMRAVWASGVGVSKAAGTTSAIDTRRFEVLKCLLCCFSSTLFTRTEILGNADHRLLAYATSEHCPNTRQLLYSLVNVVVTWDAIGWGIPYAGLITDSSREILVDASVQTLCLLLDYFDGQTVNVYRRDLQAVQEPLQLRAIYAGLMKIMQSHLYEASTYLPGGVRGSGCAQEILILLWKLLEQCPNFRQYAVHNVQINGLVAPILYLLFKTRKEREALAMMHHISCILLILSGERKYAVSLNQNIMQKVYLDDLPLNNGNYADMLFQVVHRVLLDGPPGADSIHDVLLSVLANVSPYVKTLSMPTAVRVVGLVEAFTKTIFSNQLSHKRVSDLLEVVNNIIQYQYDGNASLIYTLIRRKQVFEQLITLQQTYGVAKGDSPVSTSTAPIPVAQPIAVSEASATSAGSVATAPAAEVTTAPATDAATATTPAVTEPAPAEAESAPAEAAAAEVQDDGAGTAPPDTKPADAPTAATATTPTAASAAAATGTTAAPASGWSAPLLAAHAKLKAQEPKPMPGFPVTPEWVSSWMARLPLATVARTIGALAPAVHEICSQGYVDESQVMRYIKDSTLVGVLPVPHRIVIRLFRSNLATDQQVSTLLWAIIYVRNNTPPLFYGLKVELFGVEAKKS